MRGLQPPGRCFQNLPANPIDISPDGIVVEADDLEASPHQLLRPCDVAHAALMLLAIEFDNEPGLEANEITYVSSDWMLRPELQPAELSAT